MLAQRQLLDYENSHFIDRATFFSYAEFRKFLYDTNRHSYTAHGGYIYIYCRAQTSTFCTQQHQYIIVV